MKEEKGTQKKKAWKAPQITLLDGRETESGNLESENESYVNFFGTKSGTIGTLS